MPAERGAVKLLLLVVIAVALVAALWFLPVKQVLDRGA